MNGQMLPENPMPFPWPPSDPPDPREQPVEDTPRAKVVQLRPVIRPADVRRAIAEELRYEHAIDQKEDYDTLCRLIRKRGPNQILEWVNDAVTMRHSHIADSLPEID